MYQQPPHEESYNYQQNNPHQYHHNQHPQQQQQQQTQNSQFQDQNQQFFASSQASAAHPQMNSNYNFNSAFDNVDISRNNVPSASTAFGTVQEFVSVNNRKFQNFLDSTTPHTGLRWLVFGFLVFVFILRIVFYEGFYVVAYALGIYLLNIFLLFLSPKFDPSVTEDESGLDNEAFIFEDDGNDFLPSTGTPLIDEFRPFVRRLPEFKFWYNAITSVCVGLLCTLFPFLDIPVFWPILLMYFVILFALTMRRQIQHMIKYKYLPFDIGKKAYA